MKTKTHRPSLAPLITESERVITEVIKHFGLKTKPENILFTIQTKGKGNALGWFWANRWKTAPKAAERIHEINLSAEELSARAGEIIIHEMAHAENETLGIHDVSNRVHNKHFKTMAERLGLIVKPRDKSVGYGFTDLGDEATKFLAKIKFDENLYKVSRLLPGRTFKAGTRLLKVVCPKCGYTVRTTQKWLDVGLPTCACGHEMEEA